MTLCAASAPGRDRQQNMRNHQGRQLILDFPSRPEYSFDNFVVSEGSRFAVDAAKKICAGASPPYHSLYLHGGEHLGKTHLLIAIGNQAAQAFPDRQILYVPCEEFVRQMEQGEEAASLNARRMAGADCFLLDDVDRIAGKRTAQEKLYFIYNTLIEKGKVIVFTGRQAPDHLAGAESYLTSRLRWGMTAAIHPIDDATTAQIIHKLGQDVGLEIPDKITDYLLTRVPRDFLSIKDCVTRIDRESYLKKQKVSLKLTKAALGLP